MVNQRPEAIRLILSNGTERVVAPWGLAVLPRVDADGQPVEILVAFLLERRSIPGTDTTSDRLAGRVQTAFGTPR